jgi:hypothetical protein
VKNLVRLSLLAASLSVIGAGGHPPPQVAVSPSRVELQIGDRPTTESLTLFNYSDQPVQIAVSLAHWDLDDRNNVRIIEPDEQSLDQWMVVNPLRFSVPANSSQIVRYSIRPRVRPEPGEHRAMIYFEQDLPPEQGKLRVKFRLGVAIYAYAGEPFREGKLNSIELIDGTNPVTARLDISSRGDSHIRLGGQYAIWRAEHYPGHEHTGPIEGVGHADPVLPDGVLVTGLLPAKPVLPDTRRGILLQTAVKLEPGSYVLDLNGEIPGDSIDLALPFTVPHPARVSLPGRD